MTTSESRGTSTVRSRVAAGLVAVLALAGGTTACSSSGSAQGGASSPASSGPRPSQSRSVQQLRHTTKSPSAARSTPALTGALSGTWHGTYSGGFSGTFVVRWTQGATRLHGTIALSNPARTMPLNGKVTGSKIAFGTVGSTAITYTGSVSSSDTSMSGNYEVGNQPAGTWSATKA